MTDPSSHIGFIVAAYAIATIVIAGMAAAIVLEYGKLKSALRRFDRGNQEGGKS